ncbi:MAG TPA: PQQ-binding-like beta-propeller repeat protein [Acidimicrobiia bacterium]|nr:PQQ-binding-like beta-propeller repeat protein [Acidimicrobiia bacterium]
MRRLGLLSLAVLLLAGCGSEARHASVTTPSKPAPAPRATPKPKPRPKPVAHVPPGMSAVQVTVVDGDTNRRVTGARVQIGRHAARSDRHGVARVKLGHRAALVTVASKPGYGERAVRLPFRTHPKSTIRVYRPSRQWTMYGAGPTRTQAQPSILVRPPFRVVWSRGLDTLIEFPAVVSDGVAYIANARGTVRALDMRDGSVVWRHDTPHGKMAASPAIVGDEVVVHGMDGHVWVLRRSDGRLLWHYTVGSPVESSPVVSGGLDIFGAWNGTITALDLRGHRVRWVRHDGCKITSSAAIAGGTLYLGDYCGRLLALNPRNGALKWARSVNGRVYGTPAVAAGRIFVPSSTGGSLTAFSTGGRFLWRRSTGSYVYSSPAVSQGRVFFGSYNGVFYGVRASDGAVLWSRGTGGPISGAAVVVGGVAYAGSFAHRILGVDVKSGRVVLDFPHGEYVPVSGGGTRLLLHGYSRLYAVVER